MMKLYSASLKCTRLIYVLSLTIASFTLNACTAFSVSAKAKFSILTCTPGPDLYSLFGHTAIRYQDSLNGKWVDWVYNYGTFQFDEDFYVKFARGKLDYLLSKEDFGYFQQEYLFTGRGIFEQTLLLTTEEETRLFELLEENYQDENRTYRYDFFYDNCSTRIRDIIIRAVSSSTEDVLGFVHPDPASIEALNKVNFSYVYADEYSFRDAIQRYLVYQPWSDFGIDLALGLPCDRIMGKGQAMFLPDSLMNEFNYAIYNGSALVSQSEEILPQEYVLSENGFWTPMVVMWSVLLIHVLISLVMLRWKKTFQITDRLILFITGLLGLFVIFLWFFTDHTATHGNLNLLWANPLNLFFVFVSSKKREGWQKICVTAYAAILAALLVFWVVLPQKLHPAVIPLILALLFTSIKMIRPSLFLGSKETGV
jgi:Domain of unknown function (DUF4105)